MAEAQFDSPHISDFQHVPHHLYLLSGGSSNLLSKRGPTKLKVPMEKEKTLVALALERNRFFVISTTEELHGAAWYHLVQGGKKLGLEYAGSATATQEVLDLLLYHHHGHGNAAVSAQSANDDQRVFDDIVSGSSSIEWFKALVLRCADLGASDIHIELRGTLASVRVRIEGLMRNLAGYPARVALDGISSAYTVLAEEHSRTEAAFNAGIAQAAMIPLDFPRHRLTLRYQSHPTVGGFDVVVRILRGSDPERLKKLTLERLGYTRWQLERLNEAISSAWGGVFIAGVTGSGKTTTLNTLLAMMTLDGSRKLVTIEDPVEYEVPGVSHMSIQRLAGTETGGSNPFHAAMLAFLRMDPDVGLIGEVRDSVSGELVQAAIQTGHKILSTVHATSALGIVGRLAADSIGLRRQDMCSPEFMSVLVYQVLMPLTCTHCRRPAREVLTPEQQAVYRSGFGLDIDTIWCASEDGCPHCRKPGIDYSRSVRNGVSGVKVAAEVIIPDLQMLELLLKERDMEARRYWRTRQKTGFDSPDMNGKEAWGHALYDVSQGRLDPYYFERAFGSPALLAKAHAATFTQA